MSCALTAFSVKIVASGESAIKTAIAREAIYEWNAAHAWNEKRAFVPLFSEQADEAVAFPQADLLVVFFRAGQGGTGGLPAIDPELAQQAKSGRPLLVFVSEARTDLNETGGGDIGQLKNALPADAMLDFFKDEKEFRAKFAQRLEALVRYHPHAQIAGEISAGTVAKVEAHPPAVASFSEAAKALLMDACDDPEAYVARINDSRGLKIQVNGRQYVKVGDAASAKEWDGAFHELLQAALIRDAGCNGQLYQISSKGFAYLETLGKTPIGYIAELGSV